MGTASPPSCEFGLELIGVLPALYARAVDSTCSLPGTAPWYHWCSSHSELPGGRSYTMLSGNWPISSLHTCSRIPPPAEVWSPPPMITPSRVSDARRMWAEVNTLGVPRPPLIVHNKVCDEWGIGSVHRIPDEVLASLAQGAQETGRRMLYVRPSGEERGFTRDHNLICPCTTSDYRAVEANGGLTLQTVMERTGLDYNTAQVDLSAITDDFVSVQGGAAIVASYFGGRNLIYAKRGVELERRLYDSDSLVAALSGATLSVTDTAAALPALLRAQKPGPNA